MSAPRTAIIVVVTFLIGFVGLSTFVMESHPISLAHLSQVSKGATTSDVERFLGTPTHIDHSSSGDAWTYSGVCWCMVTIRFNDANRVVGIEHDH